MSLATALGKSPVIIGILEHVAGHKSPKVVATSIAKTGNQKLEKETRTKEQIAILQIIYQYSRAFFDNQKKQKDYLGCGLGTACIGIRFISIYNLRQKKYICAISKFDRKEFSNFSWFATTCVDESVSISEVLYLKHLMLLLLPCHSSVVG